MVAHRAAPQLVAGHAVHLAEDVPERDVDPAHGRPADDVVAVPEVLAEHHLPQVLDARGVLADDQLREVLDRSDDGARVPLERRLAPAVEAGLVRHDPDEDPVAHPCVADVRLDRRDLHVPLLTRSSSRDALVDERRRPAVADVRVRDPVRPAVPVLVEDVVQRDIGDEVEVGIGREVPGVVVRVAEDERLGEGAARADLRSRRVEELEGVRDDRDVADRERLELRPDGLVGAPDHVGVERQCRLLVHDGELLRRGRGVDRVVPRLGELACGQRAELGDPRLDLVERIGVAPSRQLDRGRRGGEGRLAGRLDRPEHVRGRRRDRRSQLVPSGVRVARRLPVPEPVVPAGDVAAAPREKEALRAGARPADGLAQRAGEVGVPEQRVAAHQRGVAGEADDDGERRPVGTVDRDHADRVVHRPLRDDPVDGDPRCAAGPEADACGRQRAGGGVDDAGDRLRQELGVAGEGRRVAQPGDAAATGEARRAVVVARVDEHGLRRDAGQRRDALAHGGREVGAGEDEVRSRRSRAAWCRRR